MSTADRLYTFLLKHGPADYYAILRAMAPTRLATVNKAVAQLREAGLIKEVERKEKIELAIK